jgi:hypothetical protein
MVLVVPRNEVGVYDYLRRSLAGTPEIEVVLDRRVGGPRPAEEAAAERRARAPADQRRILMCALSARVESAPETAAPPEPEPAPPEAPAATSPYRTLLWPALRIYRL